MFRRKRRASDDSATDDDDIGIDAESDAESDGDIDDDIDAHDEPAREHGPWDETEVADPAGGGRVDLGGMWIPGRPGLEVRIEADQQTSHVVAVTLVLAAEGALQVQAFAAPRTESVWDEIRGEIRASITKQGGTADEVDGPLGVELRTKVPVRSQAGGSQVEPARFLGVDGPRWFLRGVVTGKAAQPPFADAGLVELFRDVVVVRGTGAMAPRDPIPLSLPEVALPPAEADAAEDAEDAPGEDELKPFDRGPEITEIR